MFTQNAMAALYQIAQSDPPTLDQNADWSHTFHSFVSCLLKKNPEERFTATEALQHSWFKVLLVPQIHLKTKFRTIEKTHRSSSSLLIGQNDWCASRMRNRSRCNTKRCCEFIRVAIRFRYQKTARCVLTRRMRFRKTDRQMKTRKKTSYPRVIFRALLRVLQIEHFLSITV